MEKMTSILRKTEKVVNVTDEEELRKRGYVVGSTLGEGSYAKVKSAYSERLNKKVALKIINRKKAPKDFQQKFLPRELEVMKVIQHSNIIQMFEIMQFNDKVYIAMEIAGHGDLLEYIKLRGAISEDRSRIMFQQLVGAVDYLHKNNIIHRDLKCENILLDTQSNLKISDFGFARFLMPEDHSKTFCGSAAYAAPEILQGIPYKGTTYDVWSMGVILYIMVCGSMPFDDSNIKKMIKYQTEKKVGFSRSKKLSQEVKDLIHNMLDPSTRTRFTIYQIQHCTWLIELIQNVKKMESRSLPSADKPKSTQISPSPQPAKPQTPQPLVSNTPAPAASPPNTASPTDTQPKPQPQPQPPKDHQFQRVAKISAPKSKSVDLITEGIHSMRAS